jgi:phosphate starvation-inducible PhoH-like protein
LQKTNKTKNETRIPLRGVDQLKLFGFQDANLKKLERHFDARIVARGNEIKIIGEKEVLDPLELVLHNLIVMVEQDKTITDRELEEALDDLKRKVRDGTNGQPSSEAPVENKESVIIYTKDGCLKPKTAGQQAFYQSSLKNDIVFVIGPAGTGKTFLAVAIATAALRDRQISRIVLTRPAVEAGESLGFLPGDIREKVDPYLKPFYDALYQMLPPDKLKRYVETQVIEIVPLAYMRGRTLNNAFVILDEAQNTSFNQMKMFLTRLGINSKAIITGDVTQIDLPQAKMSGLVKAQSILDGIEGIDFVFLSDRDVVRHRLVKEIIRAYEAYESKDIKKD